MSERLTFQRRGVVEGFFGPPWTLEQRATLFEFGSARGMNTYLYAPKDDPYHRERWQEPYPEPQWSQLKSLIALARDFSIDFVYGFHPGKGLCFGATEPIQWLLQKADLLYQAGVRIFTVLFDDIPSILEFPKDREQFQESLAEAQGLWLARILDQQPAGWSDVAWWLCPSYYTEDPLLAQTFGAFEPSFLEKLARHLPPSVACFWTGPQVVSRTITLAQVREISQRIRHPVIIWDNYPVNDLSMNMEMHLGPLTGRDHRLPEGSYGYLNNPLLQPALSLIPLATCFDYARDPSGYNPEQSWERVVIERFGADALFHWRTIRAFCEQSNALKDKSRPLKLATNEHPALEAAHDYLMRHRGSPWWDEFQPWLALVRGSL